jgi:hypothetical protein
MKKAELRTMVCALAAALTLAGAAHAQTQGMERRDDRRDNRDAARATKHACKAGDEKTNAACRQAKRHVKHNGPQTGQPSAPAAPAGNPAPPQ